MADMPLPKLIRRLPEAERAKIDYELIELAMRAVKRRNDEEAIILLM